MSIVWQFVFEICVLGDGQLDCEANTVRGEEEVTLFEMQWSRTKVVKRRRWDSVLSEHHHGVGDSGDPRYGCRFLSLIPIRYQECE